jgi:transposase-like protein
MTAPKRPEPHRSPSAEIMPEAMQMLADGHRVGAVARRFGMRRQTLADWRDSPEGQQQLDAARKAREVLIADGRDGALRILREAAPLAAQRLVDALAAPSSASVGAAEAILARVGLPRSTKVEATVDPGLDLAALTDDEIATLEALHAKARG